MSVGLIKSEAELALMRESGRLLAQVFSLLDGLVLTGMSTLELDRRVEAFIRQELLARPASKGQYDYPYSINTSINEVVCHGMPDARAILCDGDIVNIDITLEKNGFIADSSKMYLVGAVSPKARRLVDKTLEALWEGIRVVKPGARLGDPETRRSQWLQRGPRILRPRHRPANARRTAGAALRPAGYRHDFARRHGRADAQPGQRPHPRSEGRLDRSDPRRQPVGAMGTHRGRHPRWLRSADPATP